MYEPSGPVEGRGRGALGRSEGCRKSLRGILEVGSLAFGEAPGVAVAVCVRHSPNHNTTLRQTGQLPQPEVTSGSVHGPVAVL